MKDEVERYLQKEGIYNIKRMKIQEHLSVQRADLKTPTLKAISTILKEDFKLRYRRLDGATVHYKDP